MRRGDKYMIAAVAGLVLPDMIQVGLGLDPTQMFGCLWCGLVGFFFWFLDKGYTKHGEPTDAEKEQDVI